MDGKVKTAHGMHGFSNDKPWWWGGVVVVDGGQHGDDEGFLEQEKLYNDATTSNGEEEDVHAGKRKQMRRMLHQQQEEKDEEKEEEKQQQKQQDGDDDDEKEKIRRARVQSKLRTVLKRWKKWHFLERRRSDNKENKRPLKNAGRCKSGNDRSCILQLPVKDICTDEPNGLHTGAHKAVCRCKKYPDVALLAHYHTNHAGPPDQHTRRIKSELRNMQQLQDLNLPVVPFLHQIINFSCNHADENSHHPNVQPDWRQEHGVLHNDNQPCAGYLMEYVADGPNTPTMFIKPLQIYESLPSGPIKWPAAVNRLLSMTPTAINTFAKTLRRIVDVCDDANIRIDDFQGLLNVNTGRFEIIDPAVSENRGTKKLREAVLFRQIVRGFADRILKDHHENLNPPLPPPPPSPSSN